MKKLIQLLLFVVVSTAAWPVFGQLTIPYADGSDGVLNITNDTVIDLSQAVTGVWTNTSSSAGKGVYDPAQWAIVFKYSSVNIASGATLSFANHGSRASVVWLVNGSVTIDGGLSLDGQPGQYLQTEPGPGGFRGGAGAYGYSSSGLGPGGGYQTAGQYVNYSYGNTNIIPLIGGSGGGAYAYVSGGGGGGAILIAASEVITVNGSCHANGGAGYNGTHGSGGAIRLVADKIFGNGSLYAFGYNLSGDLGRLRLEANSLTNTLTIYPVTVGVVPVNPPALFPAATAPTVKVLSIGGVTTPTETRALEPAGVTGNGDVAIATTTPAVIQVQTMNFPTNGTVNIYIRPLNGSPSVLSASFVSGNSSQAIWQGTSSLPIYSPLQGQPGYAVIQARAVVP